MKRTQQQAAAIGFAVRPARLLFHPKSRGIGRKFGLVTPDGAFLSIVFESEAAAWHFAGNWPVAGEVMA